MLLHSVEASHNSIHTARLGTGPGESDKKPPVCLSHSLLSNCGMAVVVVATVVIVVVVATVDEIAKNANIVKISSMINQFSTLARIYCALNYLQTYNTRIE